MAILEKYVELIHSCEKQVLNNFLEIGRYLYEIQEKHLYKAEFGSFERFLDDNGFSFSTQHAYNFTKIYKNVKSILQSEEQKLSLSELGITKLLELINQGEELSPERIVQAKSQSVAEIKGKKTTKPSPQAITALVSGFRKELSKIQKPDAGLKQELERLRDLINKLLT